MYRSQYKYIEALTERLVLTHTRVAHTSNITGTHALPYIYIHLPLSAMCPQASCIYIRQSALACDITCTCTVLESKAPLGLPKNFYNFD